MGVLHLLARSDHERRISINSIAPVWDGNEVWLLAGGGALFAAFPPVYATVFSGFYLALILLLVALMARAVSMEFRSKVASLAWARFWDWGFGIGSLLPPVLLGGALGNILRGLPLNADGDFAGTFPGLLNPYAILIGLLTLAVMVLHGAIYLTIKSQGQQEARTARLIPALWWAVLLLYAGATLATVVVSPFLFENLFTMPAAWVMIAVLLLGLLGTRKFACGCTRQYGWALFSSAVTILAMIALVGLSLFPRLVPALGDLDRSLTIHNSSSTLRTLATMLIIALIGVPLVLVYTACIYRAFRGKVVLGEESY